MKILSEWVRSYLPALSVPGSEVSDRQLADDLTLRGIAVEGVFDLGAGRGSLFETDITTNRVDAMNHYGIAREAAAIYETALDPLDTKLPAARSARRPFPVRIEARDLCGRFTARVLRDITIAPSTGKLAERFTLLEQKQISNAVDATNFVTLAMGHPTHAFDLDKLEGGIILRRARAGERLKLLDGTELTLSPDDLVVADERKALALAGVMGGWDTMITPETRNILVEAAWFDPVTVRKSSRRYGLHTDASHRFERGADFDAPPTASAMVSRLILAAGGEIEGEFVDVVVPEWAARTAERPPISIQMDDIARILGPTETGEVLDAATCERALSALGINTERTAPGRYAAKLPSWRLDLEREVDLIEEIARLYGYNRFADTLPAFSGSVVQQPEAEKERTLRRRLLGAGYFEAIGATFSSEREASAFARLPNSAVQMENPLSEEAGYLRTSLVPGMLTMLAHNLNREAENVRLFEMGFVFTAGGDRVTETLSLSLGATGQVARQNPSAPSREFSFYDMKGVVEDILSAFATKTVDWDVFPAETGLMPAWLDPNLAARIMVDGETLGYFGQVAAAEAGDRKLRQAVFVGEIYLDRLFRHTLREPQIREISHFPAVRRDISFQFPAAIRWSHIADAVASLGIRELTSIEPHEILRNPSLSESAAADPETYFLVLRVVFQAQDRTLRLDELQDWAHRIFSCLIDLGGKPRFPAELL